MIVKPGRLNVGPEHLACIENGEEPTLLEDGLPDVQLFMIKVADCNLLISFIS